MAEPLSCWGSIRKDCYTNPFLIPYGLAYDGVTFLKSDTEGCGYSMLKGPAALGTLVVLILAVITPIGLFFRAIYRCCCGSDDALPEERAAPRPRRKIRPAPNDLPADLVFRGKPKSTAEVSCPRNPSSGRESGSRSHRKEGRESTRRREDKSQRRARASDSDWESAWTGLADPPSASRTDRGSTRRRGTESRKRDRTSDSDRDDDIGAGLGMPGHLKRGTATPRAPAAATSTRPIDRPPTASSAPGTGATTTLSIPPVDRPPAASSGPAAGPAPRPIDRPPTASSDPETGTAAAPLTRPEDRPPAAPGGPAAGTAVVPSIPPAASSGPGTGPAPRPVDRPPTAPGGPKLGAAAAAAAGAAIPRYEVTEESMDKGIKLNIPRDGDCGYGSALYAARRMGVSTPIKSAPEFRREVAGWIGRNWQTDGPLRERLRMGIETFYSDRLNQALEKRGTLTNRLQAARGALLLAESSTYPGEQGLAQCRADFAALEREENVAAVAIAQHQRERTPRSDRGYNNLLVAQRDRADRKRMLLASIRSLELEKREFGRDSARTIGNLKAEIQRKPKQISELEPLIRQYEQLLGKIQGRGLEVADVDRYLQAMDSRSGNREHAGIAEIYAMSQILGVIITVNSTNESIQAFITGGQLPAMPVGRENPPMITLLHDRNHYDAYVEPPAPAAG